MLYNSAVITYYPAFIDLRGRRCVVVGGGSVAERKVASLLECEAEVVVISPTATEQIEAWAEEGHVTLVRRPYQKGDLAGAWLVIAATNSDQVNREVYGEAVERRLLINTVDNPALCSFIVPSVVRRGSVVVAVSTGGKSPALARQLRQELEHILPEELTDHLEEMVRIRERLRQAIPDPADREGVWRRLMAEGLLALLREGRHMEVEGLVEAALEERKLGE